MNLKRVNSEAFDNEREIEQYQYGIYYNKKTSFVPLSEIRGEEVQYDWINHQFILTYQYRNEFKE